jgi:phosphotriesterase-related protein
MCEYRGTETAGRTDVRAGVLKFASDYHLIDRHARKAAEAVAEAHRATGAPILTHTQNGTCGPEQVELFGKLGVAPSALLISHLDRNPDPFLHGEVAGAGAYLIYDSVSRIKVRPDSALADLICRMTQAGHADRILLGMDMGPRSMWRAYGGGPGMTYLIDRFLRTLRMAGLSEENVTRFTVRNPAEALAFRQAA